MKTENPYDLQQKGKKYDTLKKRNDELVKACKNIMDFKDMDNEYADAGDGYIESWQSNELEQAFDQIEKALKNNEND